jgi:hypothetical protein
MMIRKLCIQNILLALLLSLLFYSPSSGQGTIKEKRETKASAALPEYSGLVNDLKTFLPPLKKKS